MRIGGPLNACRRADRPERRWRGEPWRRRSLIAPTPPATEKRQAYR